MRIHRFEVNGGGGTASVIRANFFATLVAHRANYSISFSLEKLRIGNEYCAGNLWIQTANIKHVNTHNGCPWSMEAFVNFLGGHQTKKYYFDEKKKKRAASALKVCRRVFHTNAKGE